MQFLCLRFGFLTAALPLRLVLTRPLWTVDECSWVPLVSACPEQMTLLHLMILKEVACVSHLLYHITFPWLTTASVIITTAPFLCASSEELGQHILASALKSLLTQLEASYKAVSVSVTGRVSTCI